VGGENEAVEYHDGNGSEDIFVGLVSAGDQGQFLSDVYNKGSEQQTASGKDGPKDQVGCTT
jgi:hypothetical protein